MQRESLTRFAWLSIAAAIITIALKMGAYVVTGSVGLLSDALESVVNLVAAVVALVMLTIAARPPDQEHAYGHDKVEYFSSGVEGALILLAAASIIYSALPRLFNPQPLEDIGIGVVISLLAALVNVVVSRILHRAGKQHNSITLEADAHHLMTDVWTSVGVIVGIGAVVLTGWHWIDPLIALIVAGNIVWAGIQLVRRSALGLMDTALPADEMQIVQNVLGRYEEQGIQFHALWTRQAATRRFVSVHVLVPGWWTVQDGHSFVEKIEYEIRCDLPNTNVFTHLEPIEDPISWEDAILDRKSPFQQIIN